MPQITAIEKFTLLSVDLGSGAELLKVHGICKGLARGGLVVLSSLTTVGMVTMG
jgi:hypothetical protein